MTHPRPYDAILLDLDGTLLDRQSRIRPANLAALHDVAAQGVRVMVATGRSKVSTLPVLEELELDSLAVIFNGAAVFCPSEARLLEERLLSNRTVNAALDYAHARDLMTVVMQADHKFVREPKNDMEAAALEGLHGVQLVPQAELPRELAIRITFLTNHLPTSLALADEVQTFVKQPIYLTHFPLNALPMHVTSKMLAVDVHPPCRGKAEALRVLDEHYGIAPDRVIAIGDATNDIPMVRQAGLGVAMANSMSELKPHADRIIGDQDTDAIAEFLHDVF